MGELERFDDLQTVAAIAREADLPAVADEAIALAGRLAAGRFFVACVGQFKRGKSTLLNALVGEPVLPMGVTPVTSAVTILRHGSTRVATVFYANGRTAPIALEDVGLYVSEEHNHENARGVAAVEVGLPATLLASGLCLVDTPGIGSAFSGNTEAARAFVPHIDAALVVVGADPPISGDELALVVDVLARVPNALFVINKADRLPAEDLRQAREFTERLLAERLGRSIGPVLEVSATEHLERDVPTRDWPQLEHALLALAGNAGEILRASHRRGLSRLAKQLRDDLDERHGALVRPVQESEARIDVLRRSVADAEMMLRELGVLLAAEQRQLLTAFQARQAHFVEPELASALKELHAWIDRLPTGHLHDRALAFDQASTIVRRRIERWLAQIEPEADALYGRATERLTTLANQFLRRLAETDDPAFATLPRSLEPETGLREERHYYQTSLMHLTAPGWLNRLADVLLPRTARLARVARDADAYLERLLRSNTTRVVFDLEQRVEVSRRTLESELRFLLRQMTGSAERALDRARAHQQAGQQSVEDELRRIATFRHRLNHLNHHAPSS